MTLLDDEFWINPYYGRISKTPDNESHFGANSIELFKSISSYVMKIEVRDDKDLIIVNKTIKPCDANYYEKPNSIF